MMVRLFCPFDDSLVIIVDVVLVIGMAATAAAFVVASTMGINFSVVMCVEFSRMLGIVVVAGGNSKRVPKALQHRRANEWLHTNDSNNSKCQR